VVSVGCIASDSDSDSDSDGDGGIRFGCRFDWVRLRLRARQATDRVRARLARVH